ncbi:MAG: NAD(P)-dependent oxidoreductase [Pseudomonadota bacterium]
MPHIGRVLVTGGTGFVGKKIVSALIAAGYSVRVLARETSNTTPLADSGAEICYGDVAEIDSLTAAFGDIDFVVHAAADTLGTKNGGQRVTLGGTQNVLEKCRSHNVKKLIYLSSCSVYAAAGAAKTTTIDENSPLEPRPDERGNYSEYKLLADQLIQTHIDVSKDVPIVCLRPGLIYGHGTEVFGPTLGINIGDKILAVIGLGRMSLPLIYVDDVADATVECLRNNTAINQTFNIVNAETVDKKTYINKLVRRRYDSARIIFIPYVFVFLGATVLEVIGALLRKAPFLTRYRLSSSQTSARFSGEKLSRLLDWRPKTSLDLAIEKMSREQAEP